MDLNKVMLIGRLTQDPELRTTPGGQNVTTFSIATNRVWVNREGERQEKVEYHNVVAWRKLADIISQYLRKGARIYLEGHLETRSWEGQDGVKRYRTEIITDNMIMLDGRRESSSPAAAKEEIPTPTPPGESDAKKPAPDTSAPKDAESTDDEEEIKIEDIPF